MNIREEISNWIATNLEMSGTRDIDDLIQKDDRLYKSAKEYFDEVEGAEVWHVTFNWTVDKEGDRQGVLGWWQRSDKMFYNYTVKDIIAERLRQDFPKTPEYRIDLALEYVMTIIHDQTNPDAPTRSYRKLEAISGGLLD